MVVDLLKTYLSSIDKPRQDDDVNNTIATVEQPQTASKKQSTNGIRPSRKAHMRPRAESPLTASLFSPAIRSLAKVGRLFYLRDRM